MVVTRWFGGVKLGTGGLVRAYQDSVCENLATLPLAEKVPTVELDVQLDYAHLDRLHRLLPTFEARVCAEAYDQAARVRICLPEALRGPFEEAIAGRTDGRARCTLVDEA